MTAEELLKEYTEGRRDFSGENLRGVKLIGANLRGIKLSGANLRWADLWRACMIEAELIEADLSGSNLQGANLIRANMSRADLSESDLIEANMSGADLSKSYLIEANMSRADLRKADLIEANMSGADLNEANLSETNMSEANLRSADLRWADMRGATLIGADLSEADLTNIMISNRTRGYFSVCPTKGAFRGFKKACCDENHVIVELLIPEDARRSSATGRKCRCDKAQVINITDMNGNHVPQATSSHNESFIYRVGEMVEEPSFCEDRWVECAEGIHFFITREEAKLYAN